MPEPQYDRNHIIDDKTGFLVSPAYSYAFDSDKKLAFIELIKQGFREREAASQMNVHPDTIKKHLNIDPLFKEYVSDALASYGFKLESVSRINALNPKSVIERIFQLKSIFPDRYGDAKGTGNTLINLVFDGKVLEKIRKRDEVIEAEVVTVLATESTDLSDRNEHKESK